MSGKAGSGKNAAADAILEKYYGEPFAFADPIKWIASSQFGWNGRKDARGRKLLQDIGTAGREYRKDIWVDSALIYMKSSRLRRDDLAILTDTRYPNEIEKVKQEHPNAITVRITCESVEPIDHPSETALDTYDHWDYVVENNGTLKELQEKVLEITKEVGGCLK